MPAIAAQTVTNALAMSEGDLDALAAELRAAINGEVLVDRSSRLMYANDASIYQMEPVAVVFPRDATDVQAVVRIAARRGVPMLARGAGTSLAGQAVNHAIILDCSRHMNRVIEINEAEQWVRVQPGVVITALNKAAAAHGLHYAIDPSTQNRATVGGGIGNNSCGARSVRYGKTLDQVIALDVVLADGTATTFEPAAGAALDAKLALDGLEGDAYRDVRRIAGEQRDEIAQRFPKIMRRVSGYNLDEFAAADGPDASIDLTRLMVGSEGTLAVITEAKLRLMPLPAARGLVALHFESVVAACEAAVPLLDYNPAAVELIGEQIVRHSRANPSFRDLVAFVQGDPGAILLVELFGESEAKVDASIEALKRESEARGLGYATVSTTDPAEQQRWWQMRQAGLGILMSVRGDPKPVALVEDTAVAPEHLAAFVARFDTIVREHGSEAAYYGHASVGCLHIRPLVNVKDAAGLEAAKAIASDIADLVLEFGGSLSGEHGDGILRGVFTERMFGPQLTEAFRELKRAFDPQGILNPGKIVDTPQIDDYLRLSPTTRNTEPPTYLDFAADGGFARAIEQCNGQGACRKMDGGMCPSYMITRDEEHSTRGRANLLRMAISSVLPPEELTGKRVFEALDLCVECKACKSECPSGVDMAKLKYEVLAQRNDEHGLPLRSRLFGSIATLSRIASATAPVSNALARLWPVRWALHRVVGIHSQRPLPAFERETFRSWFSRRAVPTSQAPRGEVVLFDDTFTRYNHPQVGHAATRVLEALGYHVVLVDRQACCGRPAISKGMLGTAREWAAQNIEALLPYAERGVPIIGVEPSCLLALRDEYPLLVPEGAQRTASLKVAEQALLLDELIAKLADEDPSIASIFGDSDSRGAVLLHGHCHQKATAGMDSTLTALRLAGREPELIDSACCGMAGSFGFEAEHYELSQQMGALKLFPAVEAAPRDTEVAVTGVSCRQQITHFTSRHPRHVAELLANALR
ncbi:MAG TPA: FAD-linked oxidase C-terminal domain-containing protein [Dehalococcoidia bacterium]|nr:FAD-linked oxidase C-terminal domain-containing protein [Dehalococcoidia bacterium]